MSKFSDKYELTSNEAITDTYSNSLRVVERTTKKAYLSKHICLDGVAENNLKALKQHLDSLIALKHPHIANYIEYFEEDRKLIIIVEAFSTGSLALHVKNRRSSNQLFSEQLLLMWLLQLLMALDYIHRKGVMHRAINLQTVAITENAHLKLTGFALPGLASKEQNCAKGEISDKEYCLSPELCRGDGHYTKKCDMWSVGCIMWALVCLEYPFSGKNLMQLTKNILIQPLQLGQIPGCYSQALGQIIISKLLNKDENKRPGPSELLFDSTMIKSMQQYALTATELKKEFEVVLDGNDSKIRTRKPKEGSILNSPTKQSPSKINKSLVEEQRKSIAEKIKQCQLRTIEKFQQLKSSQDGTRLADIYEKEIQENLERLKKVVAEGFVRLASEKSIESEPEVKSIVFDEKEVESKQKQSSVGSKSSQTVSLIGGDNTFGSLTLQSKILTKQSSNKLEGALDGIELTHSHRLSPSTVLTSKSLEMATQELQNQLACLKDLVAEVQERPNSIMESYFFDYTLSHNGTLGKSSLQYTLSHIDLITESRDSANSLDMTMSKSLENELKKLDLHANRQLEENVPEEIEGGTGMHVGYQSSIEAQYERSESEGYQTQIAQPKKPQVNLLLSEIREVSNETSTVCDQTGTRFGSSSSNGFFS